MTIKITNDDNHNDSVQTNNEDNDYDYDSNNSINDNEDDKNYYDDSCINDNDDDNDYDNNDNDYDYDSNNIINDNDDDKNYYDDSVNDNDMKWWRFHVKLHTCSSWRTRRNLKLDIGDHQLWGEHANARVREWDAVLSHAG